jgi:hypothetical protein
MRRAEEAVLGDEADESDVALGQLEGSRRLADEASLATVEVSNWRNDFCHNRSIAMTLILIYKQQ